MDDVDRRLLEVLVDHGRVSVNELARLANVSRATAYARFERLRDDGTIRAFRADLDPARLGYGMTAIILIKVEQHGWPTVRERLGQLPGVEYVALTSGEFDFIVSVRAHDLSQLRDVVLRGLHSWTEIRTTETIFVLEEERRPVRPIPPDAAPSDPRATARGRGARPTSRGTRRR